MQNMCPPMPALSVCFLYLMCGVAYGEQFNYKLDIEDLMDPAWSYANHTVGTKIQCASMCYRQPESCFYFGYKEHQCFLLTDTVDRNQCSVEDCAEEGMKIYKVKSDATTTLAPSTTERETTTQATTTTTGAPGFNCDPPDGASADVHCPSANYLLKALGSKSPFFGDALSPTCSTFRDRLYEDSEEEEVFFSMDGGLSITAYCKSDDYIILKYMLCVKDAHIPAILLKCHKLLASTKRVQTLNATSDEKKHTLVNCGPKTALQKLYLMDSGDAVVTRVVFTCVELDAEEMADTSAAENAV